MGNTILAKGGNHILAKRDNSAWPKGSKLSGFSIIGYFTIPTVAGWIIQAGGMGSYGRNVNQTAGRAGSMAGSVAGAAAGNVVGRVGKLLK